MQLRKILYQQNFLTLPYVEPDNFHLSEIPENYYYIYYAIKLNIIYDKVYIVLLHANVIHLSHDVSIQ